MSGDTVLANFFPYAALQPVIFRRLRVVLAAVCVLAAVPAHAQSPIDRLTLIAPAAPGGGWDQTARAMQRALLTEHIARVVEVENIPGAAGTIGLAHFVSDYRGRDDALLVTGLVMLAAIQWNGSPTTLAAVAPLAALTGEPEVIVVPAGSPYRDLRSLLSAVRAAPGTVSWGGGSAGGTDQILAGLVTAAAGADPGRLNYIAFSGGGEAAAALLGGNVTAGVGGYSEVAVHINGGRLRALGLSSSSRVPGINVPTLREQDIDIDMMNWRGVVAAPGLSNAQRDRLQAAIAAMVASPTWRSILEEREWTDMFAAGDAFETFLWAERARVDRIVTQLKDTGETPASGTDWMFPGAVALSGLVVVSLLFRQKTEARPPKVVTDHVALTRVCAGLAGYAVLLTVAGFVVASSVLFWFVALACGSKRRVRDAVVGLALSVVLFVAFSQGLGLRLPSGLLGAWIR